MFSAEDRDRLRDQLIARARSDPDLVAAAAVGSSAIGGDRWSDLDLTFGVADGVPVETVLAGWTQVMVDDFDAAVLFDLPVPPTIYRVFLLPGMLQVDLSFTPSAAFGARGPRFHLLFGETVERPGPALPEPGYLFGLGIHHVVRAHICINRRRLWQAEYWTHEARDLALSLACMRLGLETSHGRGFDSLPSLARERFAEGLVSELTEAALRRALSGVTAALLREAAGSPDSVARVQSMLAWLCDPASFYTDQP